MAIEQELRVFEIKADKSLVLVQNVFIHSFPDNLHLSKDGHTIYVGSHPIIHLAMAHLADPWLKAPSQVDLLSYMDLLIRSHCVRLTPNVTNLGLFMISFQYILAQRAF